MKEKNEMMVKNTEYSYREKIWKSKSLFEDDLNIKIVSAASLDTSVDLLAFNNFILWFHFRTR